MSTGRHYDPKTKVSDELVAGRHTALRRLRDGPACHDVIDGVRSGAETSAGS